jgi:hypothetical protein
VNHYPLQAGKISMFDAASSWGRLAGGITMLAAALLFCGCGNDPKSKSGERSAKPAYVQNQAIHKLVEAESAQTLAGTFAVVEEKGTSGGKVVRIPVLPKDFEGDPGRLELSVELPADATITIWFRVLWSGNCANSFFLQLPTGAKRTVGEDGTYGKWHWVRGPRKAAVKKGPLTLIIEQRENDIAIDQVLLTSDEQYVPVGTEQ